MQLNRDVLLRAYRSMRTIRDFEERLHIEFAGGEIPGFVHLYAGEEASAVGVCLDLTERDAIASTHRGHGHCIAKGCDVGQMMKEIYGRKDGLCGGKGGSMHIADLSKGMLGANGIVGGGPPLICGAALTAKVLGTGGVAVAFIGDAASNQGTTLESYNLASVWKLPAIFVVEDNGYAEATASAWSVSGSQLKRAEGFGMPGREVDGHDVFAVYEAAREAIERARAGEGPSLLPLLRSFRRRRHDLSRPGRSRAGARGTGLSGDLPQAGHRSRPAGSRYPGRDRPRSCGRDRSFGNRRQRRAAAQ
jgi:TPP-dependent pyruvate/acetoin dehydrogenase alpha subunit